MLYLPIESPMTSGVGPSLRAGPVTAFSDSASQPQNVSITVPGTAQVGDYIVINTAGPLSSNSLTSQGFFLRTSTASGASYSSTSVLYMKICESGDIGKTYTIAGGGSGGHAMLHVFTNPRQTDIALDGASRLFSSISNTKYLGFLSSTTTTASSLAIGPTPINASAGGAVQWGPNSLKFTSWSHYGNSGSSGMSYSGPGVFTSTSGSYWWVANGGSYEVDCPNTGNTGTVTVFNSGSLAAVTMYLV